MMDIKREIILIEGGLVSACHKAGKLFIQGEFITCEKFRELFISSVKIPDIDLINCPWMKYLVTDFGKDRRFTFPRLQLGIVCSASLTHRYFD